MAFANPQSQQREEESVKKKFLTFILSEQSYGIDINHVTEIIGLQRITEVPDTPEYVEGVINLRGKVIPVIDVRLRFGLESREHDARTCIVVIEVGSTAVGLIVDTVQEVLDIPTQDIDQPPDLHGGSSQRFVSAMAKVGDSVKIILDAEALLFGRGAAISA